METEKKRGQTFLVLVPHRDVRGELRKYGDSLIKAGFTDVYFFPYIAPLASLSRALNDDELIKIARSIRENIGNGKILIEGNTVTAFPYCEKKLTLMGPSINIDKSQNVFLEGIKKINNVFSPLVIGCFLAPEFTGELFKDDKKLGPLLKIPDEKLGFRAAAVANMYWRQLQINGETCYKWKIGKLCWLPRPKKMFTKNRTVRLK